MIHKMFNSSNRRNLLSWCHYKFMERLQFQAQKRNCKVINVTEEYTSKTCGRCGNLNNKLSNKDIFKCNHCHLVIDRDINGARNILLKNLT